MKSNPFRDAKKYLRKDENSNGELFICYAINIAMIHRKVKTSQYLLAQQIVMSRLGGCTSVSDWLRTHPDVNNHDLTIDNRQAYRHRWLDHLADEWDKGVRK